MTIDRELTNKLKSLQGKFPVRALLGPRQSGKTTLLKTEFEDYQYFNLEDFDTRSAVQEDPRGFLTNIGHKVILDEVQRVPQIMSYIQTLVDSDPQYDLILSGSQNFLLMDSITQSLAGRVALTTLLPLSWEEFMPSGSLLDVMFTGSFPRIFDRDIDPTDYYPNYITTCLERDVRLLKNIDNLESFSRFLSLVAGRVGQELNYSSLATDSGVSPKTAKSWIGILKASYLVWLIPPYRSNFNKRIVKSSKLFLSDTGLICSLLGISSSNELLNYHNRGSVFENMIILEVLKFFLNRGLRPPLFFYREKNQHEIDLIIDHPNRPLALEIKSSATAHGRYFKSLDYLNRISADGFAVAVIYGADHNTPGSKSFISWRELPTYLKHWLDPL